MQNGQGKCIRYAMSHVTGKIEILGPVSGGKCFLNIIRQNMKRTVDVYSARNWHRGRRGCRAGLTAAGTWTMPQNGPQRTPDYAADKFQAADFSLIGACPAAFLLP